MCGFSITDSVISDLRQSLATNALKEKAAYIGERRPKLAGPGFGSVYFGTLPHFSKEPHFGMVTQLTDYLRPYVPMAPITTQRPSGRKRHKTVAVPPGTLPAKFCCGAAILKCSYVLLFLRYATSLTQLRDCFHPAGKLPEGITEKARTILLRE